MKLEALVLQYETENEITAAYAYQLRYAVSRFAKWLSRSPILTDLDKQTVNEWLLSEQESGGLSARSRANVRRSLMTIWAFAARENLASQPAKIRTVKVPDRIPEAWTYDQLQQFIRATEGIAGVIPNGIERKLYLRSLVWFCYETGLRRSDALSLDVRAITEQRGVVVQSKTGDSHTYQLTEETHSDILAISDQLRKQGDSLWHLPLRYPGSMSQLYYWLRRLRASAGVDATARNRAFQHLRRTGATQVELDSPQTAWMYLGHRSGPTLARKSYIDRRITKQAILPSRNRECPAPRNQKSEMQEGPSENAA